ncbi:uncharacterized protein LOC114930919 [Nylanderia fulva]|uniref:uncharacterized protein LOC114930919 n=1 Tax=Nylanderia fulva TaxID=613905 RepID=UPI0010FB1EE9|nr:uncharacterized protein LOC114930919 [Nylanderia fulva]
MLMYGAPVWVEKLCATRKIRDSGLNRVQRRVAGRVCRGYRTVSGVAVGVLSGVPPADLLARMYAEVYRRICGLRAAGEVVTDRTREILRVHYKRVLIERWKGRLQDTSLPGRRTVEAVLPCLDEWLGRAHGGVTYRTTQVLTGHGCFGEYLGRIRKEKTNATTAVIQGMTLSTPLRTVPHGWAKGPTWWLQWGGT